MNSSEKCFNFNVGSFNVRGLTSTTKQQQIVRDFEKYKLDVLCIQESKLKNGGDWCSNKHRIVLFESECRHYGNGFIINKLLLPRLIRTWKVSDRLCALEIRIDDKISQPNIKTKIKSVTIINVYGPTSDIANHNPEEKERFYHDLKAIFDQTTNSTLVIIAGDFNSKVGKKEGEESCLGSHSRGFRNENGESLIDFCEEHKLFLTNTAFNKAARHITTWTATRKNKHGNTIHIYNQIDFIVCKQYHRHLITNSQSYGGTITTSDHKLVKTTFKLTQHNLWKQKSSNKQLNIKRDRSQLIYDLKVKASYQEHLKQSLEQNDHTQTVVKQWEHIKQSINSSVTNNINEVPRQKSHQLWDKEIEKLSVFQKELRIQIQNSKNTECVQKLKKERNYVLHAIRKKALELRTEQLDKLVEDIDNSTSDGGMFKAVKILNRKKFENPKIEDKDGKQVTEPDEMHRIVTGYFKEKYRDEKINDINAFTGAPKPLLNTITKKEVRTSINQLNNDKCPGEDDICNEYLKNAPALLDDQIACILNKIFETHESIGINNGLLITLPKPGKPKGPPQNLRPITLLNSIRKVLSTIVLNRIRPAVEKYVSHSQSGFRPNRSTSDVVWAHRWITAKMLCGSDLQIKITGLDMSAAFDTIDRNKLLDILKDLVTEDEQRIIRYLLSETTINVKINGNETDRSFTTNIGTPQGDSLSPVLFIIYLENALKAVRSNINLTQGNKETSIPTEIIYADDIDFIGDHHVNVSEIENVLKQYNLKVNVSKTEFTTLNKNTDNWKNTKKVGSLLGNKEDILNRKRLSSLALNKLSNIWKRARQTKQKTRIKLYNSLVKSVLLYNCGTWAMTKTEEDRLDAFHRKQLRRVLGIFFPTKISNQSLYKKSQEIPISIQILQARWKLFGHLLRRDPEIPANKAMIYYFTNNIKKPKGRPTTTLPVTLNNDLKKLKNNKIKLTSLRDLESLRTLAQNRRKWSDFIANMKKTAEAARSEDFASGRH